MRPRRFDAGSYRDELACPVRHRLPMFGALAALPTKVMLTLVPMVDTGLTFSTIPLASPPDPANLELTFGPRGLVGPNTRFDFVEDHSAVANRAIMGLRARVLRSGQLNQRHAGLPVGARVFVVTAPKVRLQNLLYQDAETSP